MTATLYQRCEQALFSSIGDDVVALHVERGQAYGMQDVTAAVWTMIGEPTSLDSICDRLVEEYDVDRDRCLTEVGQLLRTFEREGLARQVS